MLTEDALACKKLACIDLVIITLALDKAGIQYKINDDGSLSVYNTDFAFVQTLNDFRMIGRIGDVHVEGHFNVINRHTRFDLICNQYSKRLVLSD